MKINHLLLSFIGLVSVQYLSAAQITVINETQDKSLRIVVTYGTDGVKEFVLAAGQRETFHSGRSGIHQFQAIRWQDVDNPNITYEAPIISTRTMLGGEVNLGVYGSIKNISANFNHNGLLPQPRFFEGRVSRL